MTKKLTYKDFLQETLSEKPSKLVLFNGNKATDFYLEVLGANSAALKRDKIVFGLSEQGVHEKAGGIKDKVDSIIFAQDGMIEPRKALALAMVKGSNLPDYEKILENPKICDAVIAHSFNSENYAVKK